jgi:hypothetical protein
MPEHPAQHLGGGQPLKPLKGSCIMLNESTFCKLQKQKKLQNLVKQARTPEWCWAFQTHFVNLPG